MWPDVVVIDLHPGHEVLRYDLLTSPNQYLKNRNENVISTGERVWVTWTNRAICDGTGFPIGVVSVGTDVPD